VIVPRWEWRTFGERFGAAADRLRELAPTRIDDSDELYIVTDRSEASIKVRGGVLDVKRLEQVSDDGLEQWRPVAKAEFPIAATDVAELLAALDVVVPALARDPYELDELVDEVVRPSAELHSVPVHKRRVHYALGGCMAELTDVLTGGGRGARAVVAPERELSAGTNGARRVRGTPVRGGGRRHELGEVPPRRADGGRRLAAAGRPRRGDAAGRGGPGGGRAPGSADGANDRRDRRDGGRSRAIRRRGDRRGRHRRSASCGQQRRVRVEVISGEEEARLAFLAATSGIERVDGSLIVFETGGGSTQFTFGQGERVEEQFSVPVGAVRITEQFGLDGVVDDTALASALDAIAADLASLDGQPTPAGLVAMGGAVTNLASVKHELATYDPEVVQGSELDVDELDRLIELFRTRSAEERRAIVGLQPKRAEVILAGACIVRTVMGKLGRESLTVSDRGLRHRLLVERFGGIAPDRFIR
jgi:exopolyphosphatase/guanosine-5'-triphosphate,3'-diphosphate pyrophosphatase